jgi:hypothetical protein
MDTRVVYNGYVVFCEKHDTGAIVNLNNTHDEDLYDAVSYGNTVVEKYSKDIGKKLCHTDCDSGIYLDGLSLDNKIVFGHQQKYYDTFFEGWCLEDFTKQTFSLNKIVSVCL